MQIAAIELYDLLKTKLGENEAKSLVTFIETEVENKFEQKRDLLATKQDVSSVEIRLSRAIYVVGLVQYLAIVASLIAIVKIFLK